MFTLSHRPRWPTSVAPRVVSGRSRPRQTADLLEQPVVVAQGRAVAERGLRSRGAVSEYWEDAWPDGEQ